MVKTLLCTCMYVQSYDLLKKETFMGYNCHIKTQVTNLEVLTNHYKHKFPWTVVWDKKKRMFVMFIQNKYISFWYI